MTKIVGKIASPVGSIVGGLIGKPKAPKLPGMTPVATRDDAADAQARDDEIRRRRGSAANMLLGPQGAEADAAVTATKMLTGQ
jgi:hypothetical protein